MKIKIELELDDYEAAAEQLPDILRQLADELDSDDEPEMYMDGSMIVKDTDGNAIGSYEFDEE